MTQFSAEGDQNLRSVDQADRFIEWAYSFAQPHLSGNILEIGSGIGTYSRRIIRDFPDSRVFLSEIDPRYINTLRHDLSSPRVSIHSIDITKPSELSSLTEPVNSIFMANVLEHIENDVQALNNLHERLEPSGRLVLTVPAYQALYNRLDEGAGHFRRYSRSLLISRVSQTPFRLISLSNFNSFSIPMWVWNGRIRGSSELHTGGVRFFDSMVPLLSRLDRHVLRNSLGVTLCAVLRKD